MVGESYCDMLVQYWERWFGVFKRSRQLAGVPGRRDAMMRASFPRAALLLAN